VRFPPQACICASTINSLSNGRVDVLETGEGAAATTEIRLDKKTNNGERKIYVVVMLLRRGTHSHCIKRCKVSRFHKCDAWGGKRTKRGSQRRGKIIQPRKETASEGADTGGRIEYRSKARRRI